MRFLVDTDICSAHLKGNRTVLSRFVQHTGSLAISVVTLGELCTWAKRVSAPAQRFQDLNLMLHDFVILEITPSIAYRFGTLRASLLDQGKSVPSSDLFIAATALEHQITLITHNTKDYKEIPSLAIMDWLTP